MPQKIVRLLGLGALAATGGFIALFLLLVYVSRPTEWSGLDWTSRIVTWVSVGGVAVAFAAIHVLLGRRLLALSRGGSHPL